EVLKEYQVIARKLLVRNRNASQFKIKTFAPAPIVAKWRFWYFLRQLRKFKQTTSEIVSVKRILEKTPLRLMSIGWSDCVTHNVLLLSATATRLRVTVSHSIKIVKVESVKTSKTRRVHIKQFYDSKIRFLLVQRYHHKRYRKLFSFCQPDTYY
ncbi:AAEL010335-PA, partial [Aedes aegypti]